MEETYNLRSRALAPPASNDEGHKPAAIQEELIAESARPTFPGKGGQAGSEPEVGVSLRPRAGGKSSAAGLGSTEANTIATVTIDRPPSSDGSGILRPSGAATSVSTADATVEPLAVTAAAVGQQTATTIAAAASSPSPLLLLLPHPSLYAEPSDGAHECDGRIDGITIVEK